MLTRHRAHLGRRCLRELEAHKSWAAGDITRIEAIQAAEEQATDLINISLIQFASSPGLASISALESQVLSLTASAFPDSHWPHALDPFPTLYKRLAVMSSTLGQSLPALRYSVQGCAYTQVRHGPDWSSDLLDLVKLLVPVASNARSLGAEMTLPPAELWVLFIGYLYMLAAQARQLYGGKATYTRAVERWLGEILTDASLPATAAFERKFQVAHVKLLRWAGVEDHLAGWIL